MQEMDCVEVIVEKEKYAKHGVHKGIYQQGENTGELTIYYNCE